MRLVKLRLKLVGKPSTAQQIEIHVSQEKNAAKGNLLIQLIGQVLCKQGQACTSIALLPQNAIGSYCAVDILGLFRHAIDDYPHFQDVTALWSWWLLEGFAWTPLGEPVADVCTQAKIAS